MVSADGQIEFSLLLSGVSAKAVPRPTPFKGLVNCLSLRGNFVARWHSKGVEVPFVVRSQVPKIELECLWAPQKREGSVIT